MLINKIYDLERKNKELTVENNKLNNKLVQIKLILIQKDNKIKKLEDKIKKLEEDNINLIRYKRNFYENKSRVERMKFLLKESSKWVTADLQQRINEEIK